MGAAGSDWGTAFGFVLGDRWGVLSRTPPSLPALQQRGDFMQDDPKEVAALIRRHDPHQCCRILVLSAPPCPDFSVIMKMGLASKARKAPSSPSSVTLWRDWEQELAGWHVDLLCENVVMQKSDEVQFVSSKLRAQPVAVDAADLGIINRPRLWWTRLVWKDLWTNPFTKQPFRWGWLQKLPRLFMDLYHGWNPTTST